MFPTKKSQLIENLINFCAKELPKYSKKKEIMTLVLLIKMFLNSLLI